MQFYSGRCFILILVGLVVGTCKDSPTSVPQFVEEKELVIATRNAPTTYYFDKDGETAGFEYELASQFANSLGKRAIFKIYETVDDILDAIKRGEVDFAAAGLMKTPNRMQKYLFGPEYQMVAQQLVCRSEIKGQRIQDMIDVSIALIANSSYEEWFENIQTRLPAIEWQAIADHSSEQLLEKVDQGQYDCLAVDETIFEANRHLYDRLKVKFNLDSGSQAWIFAKNRIDLQKASELWFRSDFRKSAIANLHEKYYGSLVKHDVYDIYVFKKRIEETLPKFRTIIEEAASHSKLPFELLASVSYQESHWNPKSRSQTGVRGFMMLTLPTAKSLGVMNRLDARQSMLGGAKYLARMRNRFPEFLPEEDRLWFALAAYNVGFYHLQDARHLAIDLEKNPNRWIDVKTVLPLLSNRKYYKRTRYGYARGQEPVNYVRNIRNYMRVLKSSDSSAITKTETH